MFSFWASDWAATSAVTGHGFRRADSAVLAFTAPVPFGTTRDVFGTGRLVCVCFVSLVLGGCVAERSFPKPTQMCENLREVCGDERIWKYAETEQCFQIGRAGVEDSRDEDQCFAVYDECISDCEYWLWVNYVYPDASADAGFAGDAAGFEAADAEARVDGSVDASPSQQ